MTPDRRQLRSIVPDIVRMVLVGAAYYIAGRLSLRLSLVGESVTPLWPPTGIALVGFLVFGARIWPGVALAAFFVNLGTGAGVAAGIAAGNTIAPLIAFYLLRLVGFRRELDRTRDAIALVLLGALAAMSVSATFGALSLLGASSIQQHEYWSTWSVWWAGDAMGVLAVAPFLLSLGTFRVRSRFDIKRAVEALALFAALAAAAATLLVHNNHSIWVLVFPLLGWAAWRFEQRGAAPAALLVIGMASWAAAHGQGPFSQGTLLGKMAALQTFNAAVAFTSFFFAAIVAERATARRDLERAAIQLEAEVRHRTAELKASTRKLERETSVRQETQELLERREIQLSAAEAVASIGSWEWDISEDVIEWSDELYQIYGIEPHAFEATYRAFLERTHPEDRELVSYSIEQSLTHRAPFGFDHRIVRPDGQERVLQSRGRVVTDPSGASIRMLGIAQDITEQIEAQRALKESEEVFRSVFETAVIGMAQCDPDGRIVQANVAFQHLVGLTENELQKGTLAGLTSKPDRPRFEDLFVRMARGEIGSFEIETRLRAKDDRQVWVQTSISMVRNDEGEARFVHAIVRDLSERKRAESLQRVEEERIRLRSLFERVPAAVLVTRGAEHVVEFANDAFLHLVGPRDCVGKPAREIFPELQGQDYFERMDEVLSTGQAFTANETLVQLNGAKGAPEEGYFNFVFQPLRESDGRIGGVMTHGIEVTDAVRSRLRITESLAFLDTLLATAPAGFAVFDSEARYIHINQRLAEINGFPIDAHLGRKISEVRPDIAPVIEPLLRRVMETRAPVIDQQLSGERRDMPGQTRHLLASFYPVLTPDGRLLGAGVVVIENTEQKRIEQLLSGQKQVLELVARGTDVRAALTAVVHLAEEQASGDVRASILLLDQETKRLRLGVAPEIDHPFRDAIDGMQVAANTASCGAAAFSGKQVIVTDIASHPNWATLRHLALGSGYRAAWSSPIVAGDGTILGTFCMYCSTTREPSEQERTLIDVATQTAAIALERERFEIDRQRMVEREREVQSDLYQREHRISETLQRSLLPDRLPDTPDVGVAARYIPASGDVEVGGDWYDIISMPNGKLGIAIGDVAGHGVTAAAAMGQMRMALRAYALEELTPALALERLNLLLHELQPDAMATLAYAQIDPETGVLTLAKAGHPPPLLITQDGKTQYIEGGLAPPLGVDYNTAFEETQVTLPQGATLVFYTDGLIERRDESVDTGMARLAKAAASAPDDIEAAADDIIDKLLSGHVGSDDTALLVVRRIALSGRPLHLRIPAQPLRLPSVRRIVGRWLSQNELGDEEAAEVLIACTEACTNAMRHAYGSRQGWVEIDASIAGQDIVIAVRDFGRWKAPGDGAPDDGGRGLKMMRGLMSAVEISSGIEGTEVRMRRQRGALV